MPSTYFSTYSTRLWRCKHFWVCAAVYVVVQQGEKVIQQLVCAKFRRAKKSMTVPGLELITGQMSVILATNVKAALSIHPSSIHCWLDSTVCRKQGRNQIQQHKQVTWHDVPSKENPADIGSRGGNAENDILWKEGPTWLGCATHQSGRLM